MNKSTIAQNIIKDSDSLADARASAIEKRVDIFITGGESKAVYEFADDSLLILDFDSGRMVAA